MKELHLTAASDGFVLRRQFCGISPALRVAAER